MLPRNVEVVDVVEVVEGGRRLPPTVETRRFRVLLAENGVRPMDVARALRPGLSYSQVWGMLQGVYGHPVTVAKQEALCAALSEVLGRPVAATEIWGEAEVVAFPDGEG